MGLVPPLVEWVVFAFTTYHGDNQSHGGTGDFSLTSTLVSEHTFIVGKDLTVIKYQLYTYNDADGDYPNGSGSWVVKVKQSGSWTTLWSGSCGEGATIDTGAVTQTGAWTGVEAINTTVTATSGGDRSGYVITKIYEIEAFGPIFSNYAGVV